MFTVIGTTTFDVIVTAPDRTPGRAGDEFTTESLVFCEHPMRTLLGGNGANSAYVLASLGAPTALCSAVGDDLPGRLLQDWLDDVDVDQSDLIEHAKRATSSTTIISDARQNRQAFHHHGSSAAFGPDDLSRLPEHQRDVLLITGYTLLSKWRTRVPAELLHSARRDGVVTALDIGPAIGRPVILDELQPLLPHLDYLFCNDHEACVCTDAETAEASGRRLQDAGGRTVVIKLGAHGAAFLPEDGRALTHVNGFSVDVRQTVGAGDSFNAAFLYARHHGYSLREAVLFANAVAALVVASGKGVLGCPSHKDIQELLAEEMRSR